MSDSLRKPELVPGSGSSGLVPGSLPKEETSLKPTVYGGQTTPVKGRLGVVKVSVKSYPEPTGLIAKILGKSNASAGNS